MKFLEGKKTYIVGVLIAIFGTLQTDPNFMALMGSWSSTVTQILGVLVVVSRALSKPA